MKLRRFLGITLLCVCFSMNILASPAMAAVSFTKEPAGGADTIYVAGNPDWYPVEYYNPKTECYEGALPELLKIISEKTGLNFTYIKSGEKDQRKRLAKNNQAEIISGCASDDPLMQISGVTPGSVILSISEKNEKIQAVFAYTAVADKALKDKIETALKGISGQELAGVTLGFMTEQPQKSYPVWLLFAGLAVLLLLLAVIAFLSAKLRRRKKTDSLEEWLDPATGIANKAYFIKCFDNDISDQYRVLYCVAYIGFDIARVNQYYGEEQAEEQLRFAANELFLSAKDNEFLARVSGGGFAFARPTSGEAEAGKWAEELLSRLDRYTEKYGKDYRPTFSIGIYMLKSTDRDCNTVLFNAKQGYDLAVNTNVPYAFSHTEHLKQESDKLQLKKQTMEAIKNRQFKMFLQFIVRMDGSIAGAETLSRWNHPQMGLLYPDSYISLLESEKTISELDFYIFDMACRQIQDWGIRGRNLTLTCNFARITLEQEDFASRLEQIAGRYSFRHSQLVIEITEDSITHDKQTTFENVSLCKKMGFRIALDDMGSGYTSFSDLRDYPIDIVKVDRSILTAAVDLRGVALLKGIIDLAHNLGMEVLCEGVETVSQVDLLRSLNCDRMQGYYFYRALPQETANQFLNQNAKGI